MGKKILTTANLSHIKNYTIKGEQNKLTLDNLLENDKKILLIKSNNNVEGGDATDQKEDKNIPAVDIWKTESKKTASTYKKFSATINMTGGGSISSIPMYLKRENIKGKDSGAGSKGYTGCQSAASSMVYDSSVGELKLNGLGENYDETIIRYEIKDWLTKNYPNKTYSQLPNSIDAFVNGKCERVEGL